jgi:hypothetical protein
MSATTTLDSQKIGLALVFVLIGLMSVLTTCSSRTQRAQISSDFKSQLTSLDFLVAPAMISTACRESLKLGSVECRTTYDLTPATARSRLESTGWTPHDEDSSPKALVFRRATYILVVEQPGRGVTVESFYIKRR